MLALDWKDRQIAQALRITATTMRKHYFVELRQRDEALPALKASRLFGLWKAAIGGNVGAMKELGKIIDAHDLKALAADVREPAKPKRKLGKKEQQIEDAGSVTGKFAPPPAPMRMQ
ncbi:hypothetical protein [Methyloligella halotolerans]|uniref:hypothetical protein n=1 Tax=Methyloligella halotolerans TaxID=1177755 RepID=UPI00114C91A3|nr:hypothetical protein [Methyloligella halotolerans]